MADSGWRLIVEQDHKTPRSFYWCGTCWAPIAAAEENGADLEPWAAVLPVLGFRAVHSISDIYLTRAMVCQRCGGRPR